MTRNIAIVDSNDSFWQLHKPLHMKFVSGEITRCIRYFGIVFWQGGDKKRDKRIALKEKLFYDTIMAQNCFVPRAI